MNREQAMGLNRFDGTLYINLDHRKERKKNLLSELKRLKVRKEKIHRISAVYDPLNGIRGCVSSHIQALSCALQKRWETTLILEDDCSFIQDASLIAKIITLFFEEIQGNWDVFLLGGRIDYYEKTKWPFLLRVLSSQRAHAYAISRTYIPPLKACFEHAYESMRNDLFFCDSIEKALDISWKPLQKKDRWYVPVESIAQQSLFFSDIEHFTRRRPERKCNL